MFFNTWAGLGRVVVSGVLTYIALILLVRISGKRTLSKMNAFDLVITIALGSVFATIILSKDVALAEGILALSLLVTLQFMVAWLSMRVPLIKTLVKAEPTLLFHQGDMLQGALRHQRVTPDEVRAAIRAQGVSQMSEVEAVILETDGSLSVLKATPQSATSAVNDVDNYPSVGSA